MRMKFKGTSLALFFLALFVEAALAQSSKGISLEDAGTRLPGADRVQEAQAWMPLEVGNRWVFRSSSGGRVTSEVVGTKEVGGTGCAVVTMDLGFNKTDEYLTWTSEGLVAIVPNGLGKPLRFVRLPSPVKHGDQWTTTASGVNAEYSLDANASVDINGKSVRCIKVVATVTTDQGTLVASNFYAQGLGMVRQDIKGPEQEFSMTLIESDLKKHAAETPEKGADPLTSTDGKASTLWPLTEGSEWSYREATSGHVATVKVTKQEMVKGVLCALVEFRFEDEVHSEWLAWTSRGLELHRLTDEGARVELESPILRIQAKGPSEWSEGGGKLSFKRESSKVELMDASVEATKVTMTAPGLVREEWFVAGQGPVRMVLDGKTFEFRSAQIRGVEDAKDTEAKVPESKEGPKKTTEPSDGPKFCAQCGTAFAKDAKFCAQCGQRRQGSD